MKSHFVSFAFGLLLVSIPPPSLAEEHPIDLATNWSETPGTPGRMPGTWNINTMYNEGSATLVEVEDGLALELKSSEEAVKPFHIFNKSKAARVDVNVGTLLTIKVTARGSGNLSAMAYLYDADGESVYPSGSSVTSVMTVNETWKEYEFSLTVPETRKAPASTARIALIISPASTIQIKSATAMCDSKPAVNP